MATPTIYTLVSLTGTGTEDLDGAVFNIGQFGIDTLLVQVRIQTAGTVLVQGRVDSTYTWYSLFTTSTDGDSAEVAVYPEMRATITNANGLVKVAGVVRGNVR